MNTDTAVPQVLPGGISHNLRRAVLQAVHNLALRQAGHRASLSSAAGWARSLTELCGWLGAVQLKSLQGSSHHIQSRALRWSCRAVAWNNTDLTGEGCSPCSRNGHGDPRYSGLYGKDQHHCRSRNCSLKTRWNY